MAEAEEKLKLRIVALGSQHDPVADALIEPDDEIVGFGPVSERRATDARLERVPASQARYSRRTLAESTIEALARINPILRAMVIGAVLFYGVALLFFHFSLHLTWPGSAFDVVQAMTSTGFGDSSVVKRGAAIVGGAIIVMIGGTIFTSIFIGYVSAAITRAQWTAQQGLRRIRARGPRGDLRRRPHRKRRREPVDRSGQARRRDRFASRSHAGAPRARKQHRSPHGGTRRTKTFSRSATCRTLAAVVVLTNSDPGNLEIALGARALRADVPLVVRMENRTFAQATARLFGDLDVFAGGIERAAFAGLARFPGTLGRVSYAGEEHTIVQRWGGLGGAPPTADAGYRSACGAASG